MAERQRKCIATGEVADAGGMVRLVAAPDGTLVPDLAGDLPGRGIWLTASRAAFDRALKRRAFARAAKRPLEVAPDLADQVALRLRRRCLEYLGLARRAGQLVTGFEKVKAALAADRAAVLVQAADGAADGRAKLRRAARGRVVIECFGNEELSLALGRENVVHAALAPGRLADRLVAECERLAGFDPVARHELEEAAE